jgi:hypothetical protein
VIFALLGLASSLRFEIPIYQDCDYEHAVYTAKFPHNEELYGERDNLDRKAIFCAKLERIKAHNVRALAGEETYSKGINQFSDWTVEEFGAFTNGLPVWTEEMAAEANLTDYDLSDYDPSATSDFRGRMPGIKNQGGCGSCWTFSAVDVIDFFGGSHSEQQLVDCSTTHGCSGGWPQSALNWAAKYGSDTESQYPYTGREGSCKQSGRGDSVYGVQRLTSSANSIAAAGLKQVVSTCIQFSATYSDDFGSYRSGIFSGHCGGQNGGHAIGVVGVQSSYYIIRNSWGGSWGISGYMYMARGANVCSMESGNAGPPVIAQR